MTLQQASLTVAVPRTQIEQRLRDVTRWTYFLIDVESAERTSHERYRFRLTDGRVVPVVARFHPRAHRFTWYALSGPPFDGVLHLTEVDASCTQVTLRLTTRPAGTMANFLEMISPSTSRAAVDLLRLTDYVHPRPT